MDSFTDEKLRIGALTVDLLTLQANVRKMESPTGEGKNKSKN